MSGINKATLVGNLGNDPDIKNLQSGKQVATFSVATNEKWKDQNGQQQERTEWHRVVCWGKLAEIAGKYLKKGKQVYIEGKIQTRSWEDQQGQKRYTTEIVCMNLQMLGSTGSGNRPPHPADQQDNQSQGQQDYGPEPNFDADEEIPL